MLSDSFEGETLFRRYHINQRFFPYLLKITTFGKPRTLKIHKMIRIKIQKVYWQTK